MRRGGVIMRIRDVIIILLFVSLFGLAVASVFGLRFDLSTLTFLWGPSPQEAAGLHSPVQP